jgi:hypothetical protein
MIELWLRLFEEFNLCVARYSSHEDYERLWRIVQERRGRNSF